MGLRLKKSYKFAFRSSIYITLFSTGLVFVLTYLFFSINWLFIIAFAFLTMSFSFFVLQYRVEKFIYKRVKKIYDEISFLDAVDFKNQAITTDMATLTKQVKKFATDKKLEIEMLKDREEYRREFLGNVSHELKTPLFTVQGYISTLLDGAHKDKILRKKYLERAEKGVERLVYIVNDLDMIAKLELGDEILNIESFDIVSLAQDVMDLLEIKANTKEITLSFDEKYVKPIQVAADKQKIQQVLINLVVNSIKYGKEKGSTEICIDELENNKVLIRVMDNGEGIERKYIPRLFERFFRVDKSGSRMEGGSGLGLSIVKHIIEAHHQKIYVKSTFKKGSEFLFTLQSADKINL
ncbi:cell wall metabolism sensor histidine kinase WalK [Flavobacterium columnare]|uniref:histidine kinase n=2 Tax=Flavobacterium TaxID=237 RepID=A0A2N9P8I8_9FLAO|nr:ATP-binding protein [Flavobacterium columnare]RVU90785.1 sensor histidine kinase [Flavobacterium columnare]SPE76663.1 Alkaline phosphatase synthesis sensor protein PhoR [Flavobacterium columnare]